MMRYRHRPSLSGVALAAAGVLGLAAPTQAAFPGSNGKIAVAFFDDPGGGAWPARSGIALLRADRGPAQQRTEVIACADNRRPPRECLHEYATPAFSPNGRWIVFDAARSSAPQAVRDLYVVRADGSGRPKRVVGDAADPSWSVDGLFAYERPSSAIPPRPRRILVSRPDGTRARAVSSGANGRGDFSSDPDFSPDGSRIVYYSSPRGRLTVVGTDGRGTRQLAAATAAGQHPAWSPDGRRLAWWYNAINVARSDGTHAHAIAKDGMGPMSSFNFWSSSPSWQPLSR